MAHWERRRELTGMLDIECTFAPAINRGHGRGRPSTATGSGSPAGASRGAAAGGSGEDGGEGGGEGGTTARSPGGSEQPAFERLYHLSQERERARAEREAAALAAFPFAPAVTAKAIALKRAEREKGSPVSPHESLYARGKAQLAKMREYVEAHAADGCTFAPEVTKKAAALQRAGSAAERLYNPDWVRRRKAEERNNYDARLAAELPFRPAINHGTPGTDAERAAGAAAAAAAGAPPAPAEEGEPGDAPSSGSLAAGRARGRTGAGGSPGVRVFDRLFAASRTHEEALAAARERAAHESVAACTFRPDTTKSRQSGRRIGIAGAGAGSGAHSARSGGSAGHDDAGEPTGPGAAGGGAGGGLSARSGGGDGKEAHDRLYEAALAKAARARAAAAEAAASTSPDCTFRPAISAGSRRLLAAHGRDGDGLASAPGAAHVPRHLLLYEDGLHRQQQRLAAEANRGPEGLKPDDLINCSFQPTVHTLPSRLVAPAAVPVHDRLYENARAKQAALAAAVAALRSPPTQFGPGAPTASQAAAAAAQAHQYAYAASAGVAGRIPSLNTSPVPLSRSASRSPTRGNGASSSLCMGADGHSGESQAQGQAQAPIFPSVRLGFTPPPVLARDVVSTTAVQAAGARARSRSRDGGDASSARSVGSAHGNSGSSAASVSGASASGNPNSKPAADAGAAAAPAAPAPAAAPTAPAPAPAVAASADGSLFPPLPAGLLFSVSPPTVGDASAAAAAAAASAASAPAPVPAAAPAPAPAPTASSAGPAQGLAGRVTFPVSPPPMSPFSVGAEAEADSGAGGSGSAAASPPQAAAGGGDATSAAQA